MSLTRAFEIALTFLASLVVLGLLALTAGLDGYLDRGAVWGAETATLRPTSKALGVNTFLHFEVERVKVDRTARMLREAGITLARQQIPWDDIEPKAGTFVDSRGVDTWAKYDYFINALAKEGVQLLARIENTPAWARPGEDTANHRYGPPQDYSRYATFVASVVRRYKGKIAAVQVWNEPNLDYEWGGKKPDPAAYTDLLRRTQAAVRAVDPTVVVVSAGLAPTDGLHPGTMNDLEYLDAMYAAGAKGTFDAMGVMVYGLGQSPDNRHGGLRFPINYSRPVMTREVMVRNNDAATPIWAGEFSWISVPPEWTGRPSTWGNSISEERQADYLLRGLERARGEWPWMGPMCVWAFRFVESTMDPLDAQRHFAIVRDDFSPRPAYTALAARADRGRATPGTYLALNPLLHYEGRWESQSLAGRTFRLATPGAAMAVDFSGDRVALLARRSIDGGRLYVTVDGNPVAELPSKDGRSFVSLRANRTAEAELLLVRGLLPGQHRLEVTAGDDGEVAIAGLVVSQERPFGWAFTWLQVCLVLLLAVIIRHALRLALVGTGYLPLPADLGDGRHRVPTH